MGGGQDVVLVQDGSSAAVESGSRLPRNLVFEFSGSGIVSSDNSAVNSGQCTDWSAVFDVSYERKENFVYWYLFDLTENLQIVRTSIGGGNGQSEDQKGLHTD